MRNIFLGVSLAPYRVDFYNYLYKYFNCNIYFQNRNLLTQTFNMDVLYKQCYYKPQFLKGICLGNRKLIIGLNSLIKKNNPDFVFVPEFSILTIQVIILKIIHRYKFKIVSICDDSYDMVISNDLSMVHRIARNIVTPYLDNLFLVDRKVCNWYNQHYQKGIWMPIIYDEKRLRKDYERLLPKSKEIEVQYKLNGKKVILYIGRLINIKNVDSLIKAFNSLKIDDVALVIVGDGNYRDKLMSLVENNNDSVIFPGRLEADNLFAWYNIADIFVLPSYIEPFGAVTSEALIAGCYCLISEKAGSSCLIEEDLNGKLIDPYSIEDIAEKLKISLHKIHKEKDLKLKPCLMEYRFKDLVDKNMLSMKYC